MLLDQLFAWHPQPLAAVQWFKGIRGSLMCRLLLNNYLLKYLSTFPGHNIVGISCPDSSG